MTMSCNTVRDTQAVEILDLIAELSRRNAKGSYAMLLL